MPTCISSSQDWNSSRLRVPWAGKLPMMPSAQQASVSAGLDTRNIGAAMTGIAMRSISLCTSARAITRLPSDFAHRRRRGGHARLGQFLQFAVIVAQQLAQHFPCVLAEVGRGTLDRDAPPVEPI